MNRKKKQLVIIISLILFIVAIIIVMFVIDPWEMIDNTEDEYETVKHLTESPVLNVENGKSIPLDDFTVKWEEVTGADKYIYFAIALGGQPEYGNENEAERPGSVVLKKNLDGTVERQFVISADELSEGKWIKIAVAACLESEEKWSVSYYFVAFNGGKSNTLVTIDRSEIKPVADGKIDDDEYGQKIHSVDYSNQEFLTAFSSKDIDSDFYMTWDTDSLYFAWEVRTDDHWPTIDFDGNGAVDSHEDLTNMWMYSGVQFMLCLGTPAEGEEVFQQSQWKGDYIDVGLSILDDNSNLKFMWSDFIDNRFEIDDVCFIGARNPDTNTTVYEVSIPWAAFEIDSPQEGFEFGFTYAIGDQEDYNKEPNMVAWQNGILGKKNMDAAGIIRLG